jgi:hypothetical protein
VGVAGGRVRDLLAIAGLVLALLSPVGCATLEFGTRLNVDRLDGLTRGVSTKADVLLLLGEPRGSGGAHVSPESKAEVIWLYEFMRMEGKEASLEILLVFFDEDRYDGHLWFRSVEEIRVASEGARQRLGGVGEEGS